MNKRFDRLKVGEKFIARVPSADNLRGDELELTFVQTRKEGNSYLYIATDGRQAYVHYGGMWVPAPDIKVALQEPQPEPQAEPSPTKDVQISLDSLEDLLK